MTLPAKIIVSQLPKRHHVSSQRFASHGPGQLKRGETRRSQNFVGLPTYCSTKAIQDLEPIVVADLFCPKRHEGEYQYSRAASFRLHSSQCR